MTQYYECHITIEGDRKIIEDVVTNAVGWKFSAIDGDPSLGEGVKCYATMHYNNRIPLMEVIDRVQTTAKNIAAFGHMKIVREKVEIVVYDTRSKSVTPL